MVTDREKILIAMLVDEGLPCPYEKGIPITESGRMHCNKGCWEEPGCDSYPSFDLRDHPDLEEAVLVSWAWSVSEERPPGHPIHAWLHRHDPSYEMPEEAP